LDALTCYTFSTKAAPICIVDKNIHNYGSILFLVVAVWELILLCCGVIADLKERSLAPHIFGLFKEFPTCSLEAVILISSGDEYTQLSFWRRHAAFTFILSIQQLV